MKNKAATLILISAVIGVILGAIGNILGSKALDYKPDYNFTGTVEMATQLEANEKAGKPYLEFQPQNTLLGGIVCGLIAGILIGLISAYIGEGGRLILGGLVGFFASPFICSPYPFYATGTIPPVAHNNSIFVLIPGIIIAAAIIYLLDYVVKPKLAGGSAVPAPSQPAAPAPTQQQK